jgi:hypothetical protein
MLFNKLSETISTVSTVTMSQSIQKLIAYSLPASLILVASFAQWLSLPKGSITIYGNAWKTSVTVFEISLQNWLVVAAAIAIMLLLCLRTFSNWQPPSWIFGVLSVYGALHSSLAILVAKVIGSTFESGPTLSFVGFISFCILIYRDPEMGLRSNQAIRKFFRYIALACLILFALFPILDGSTAISSFSLPNWLLAVATIGATFGIGLRYFSNLQLSKWFPIGLSLYGLIHSGLVIVLAISNLVLGFPVSSGIASILVFCAFLLLCVLIFQDPELNVP